MITPNEGKVDRVIRIALSIVVFGIAITSLTGLVQIIAILVAAIALITGILGFCGLYKILGITTLGKSKKSK